MELGNSGEAIKHAVMYEMGISCLSRRVIQDQIESGSLKRDKGRRSKITTYFIFWSIIAKTCLLMPSKNYFHIVMLNI